VENDVRLVSLVIWGALGACAVGLEIAGRCGVAGFAPVGRVLAAVRAKPAGRAILVILWMWLGWHLFAR
jgi:hypothetical protein